MNLQVSIPPLRRVPVMPLLVLALVCLQVAGGRPASGDEGGLISAEPAKSASMLRLFSLENGHLDLVHPYAPTAAASSSLAYDVVVIEPSPGKDSSRAYGLNSAGQVTGRSQAADGTGRVAFLWDPVLGTQDLPTLDGESSAWGISDAGQISGFSFHPSGFSHAVRWDTAVHPFTVTDIGTLTNITTSVSGDASSGYGLNNSGQVAGYSDIPNDDGTFTPFHAILHDDSSGIQDLETFETSYPQWQNGYSVAYDVNSQGEAVGIANDFIDPAWVFLPFFYDGTLRKLNYTNDPLWELPEWNAVTINDSGLIGGHVLAFPGQSLPHYWPDWTSDPVALTMPAAFPYGEIYAVNEQGVMVGIMWDDLGLEHAFVFDVINGVRDLNDFIDPTSGWVLNFARDINDAGQIVGTGDQGGEVRGFLLDPMMLLGDELTADFADEGMWHFASGSWAKITPWDPERMTRWQGKVAAAFGLGRGLYLYDPSGWELISGWDPYDIVAWGDQLAAAFDSDRGLWLYGSSGWARITTWEPVKMVAWGEVLAADFGTDRGIWLYDGTSGWRRITTWVPYDMVAWGDKLVAAFDSGRGLWTYESTGWTQRTSWEPDQMVAWGDQLAAAFGSGRGLWLLGTSWARATAWDPYDLVAWGDRLAAAFDTGRGIWLLDAGGWNRITTWEPIEMDAMRDELAAAFGAGRGIYSYGGTTWGHVTSWDPAAMEPVDIH